MTAVDSGRPLNVLIGCTGSVASVKVPLLCKLLIEADTGDRKIQLKLVATTNSLHFFDRTQIPPSVPLLLDEHEWETWQKMSDPVLHIELRRWADLMVIAPLDANTLAKIACGLCDNLITCVARAWDMGKPLLFCPAMNTHMWSHPVTGRQIQVLKELGYSEVACIEKKLACGDTGFGAMAEVPTIVAEVLRALQVSKS
ncbi:hypothetical protein HPB47_025559 [Ixodes persulcatus]|uniref:Uncharacterized protein n=1 Tax=Ixodes persulcatus TaxID=34615 RepID=A0AC60Q1H4_IXOPE|nr:hypothetical protein HPB47_025559 [Ixodes persulcatus]